MGPIHLLQSVDSTNDLALQSAAEAVHGECWCAEQQTKGRGRREIGGERRSWFSPRGVNLYMSVLLKPEDLEPARAAGLTLAAGIGICEALAHDTDLEDDGRLWLKWPNDVYVADRKLGGVLTEASTSGNTLDAVVVGVGLNINLERKDVPEELAKILTSVRMETGNIHDRLALLNHVRNAIVTWCDAYVRRGFPAMNAKLGRWDQSAGRAVEIPGTGKTERGVALGIDEEGHLRVELESGEIRTLGTGEVRLIGAA